MHRLHQCAGTAVKKLPQSSKQQVLLQKREVIPLTYRFNKDEIETVINIDHYENKASIYTNYMPQILRLKKMAEQDKNVHITFYGEYEIMAKVPKKYIKISRPRQLSEESKAKASERLKAMRRGDSHD